MWHFEFCLKYFLLLHLSYWCCPWIHLKQCNAIRSGTQVYILKTQIVVCFLYLTIIDLSTLNKLVPFKFWDFHDFLILRTLAWVIALQYYLLNQVVLLCCQVLIVVLVITGRYAAFYCKRFMLAEGTHTRIALSASFIALVGGWRTSNSASQLSKNQQTVLWSWRENVC